MYHGTVANTSFISILFEFYRLALRINEIDHLIVVRVVLARLVGLLRYFVGTALCFSVTFGVFVELKV